MITLGVDYGASNIGTALVHNHATGNDILFAGTVKLEQSKLKELSEPRAALRRLRRTRKTKKRRLANLRKALTLMPLDPLCIVSIVRFCKKRGWISLFGENEEEETPSEEAATTYRFSREDFFKTLENELNTLIPDTEKKTEALGICERILNRAGERSREIRPIRIENRGVSRCAWEGCEKVTPRRINAIRDALSQQIYTVLQGSLREDNSQRAVVEKVIDDLTGISKRIHSVAGSNPDAEKKALKKQARNMLKDLGDQMYNPEEYSPERRNESWKKIRDNILNLMEGVGGRNRYCGEHSRMYIDTILAGNAVPFKKTLTEADITSRREQIAFARLWRYIQARVLSCVLKGIDRIVVERTAIDLLAGKQKTITKTSDSFKEDLYQQGPMYGFSTVRHMLKEEFGGLCAYCGRPTGNAIDRDHILPRAEFLFDGYLNILPACPDCNSNVKRAQRMSDTCGHIHEDAYNAYCDYLRRKFRNKPMHTLHAQKKGLLNLMRDPARTWEAEQYLTILANEYAAAVQSNRGPRPFARYLCKKLEDHQGRSPDIRLSSGRHTALFRRIAYPAFNKLEDKLNSEKHPVNHAIDAIILASDLPFPYPLEGRSINWGVVKRWSRNVKQKAPPENTRGIPTPPTQRSVVPGFEEENEGYIATDLNLMKWNWKDRATYKQDPYGCQKQGGKPIKRESASNLYTELCDKKNTAKVPRIVEGICHPSLRGVMKQASINGDPGPAAAQAMREWLCTSVRNSLDKSHFSNNPGDIARKEELVRFAAGEEMPIPAVIGVRCVNEGAQGKIDLERLDPRTGKTGHRYMTDPANKGIILAYPKRRGSHEVDYSKPSVAHIRQNNCIQVAGKAFLPVPPNLCTGKIFGQPGSNADGWKEAVEAYLRNCGFLCYGTINQGCVLCYRNGSTRFVQNFAPEYGFRMGILKDVIGVRRSPFAEQVRPLVVL